MIIPRPSLPRTPAILLPVAYLLGRGVSTAVVAAGPGVVVRVAAVAAALGAVGVVVWGAVSGRAVAGEESGGVHGRAWAAVVMTDG